MPSPITPASGSAQPARLWSKIFRPQSGPLRDASEHPGSDLLTIVKGDNEIGPARTLQSPMRARLSLRGPSEALERGENLPRSHARPIPSRGPKRNVLEVG